MRLSLLASITLAIIRYGASHTWHSRKITGKRQIRSTEFIIPIAAMPFTASIGDAVACNQRSVPDTECSDLDAYDFGMVLADSKNINIQRNTLVDIAKHGITGVAKSGKVSSGALTAGVLLSATPCAGATRDLLARPRTLTRKDCSQVCRGLAEKRHPAVPLVIPRFGWRLWWKI